MKSVQKTDDGRLSEGSNPSASATALILCGIRAGEGFFFCFSLRISDSNGVNGRILKFDGTVDEFRQELANRVLITLSLAFEHEFINFTEQTGITRAQYEILAAEYIAHAEDDGSKVSEMFKGDDSEKTKPKGWTSATPQNRRS